MREAQGTPGSRPDSKFSEGGKLGISRRVAGAWAVVGWVGGWFLVGSGIPRGYGEPVAKPGGPWMGGDPGIPRT